MYTIEPPRASDAHDVGPMQVAAWLETYPHPESGIDEAWITKTIAFLKTPEAVAFRQAIFARAERPDRALYRVVRSHEGEVLGFLHGERHDNGTVELAALYLRNSLKGRGVGQELMQQFMTWAGDADMKLTVVSYNDRAIAFYSRFGFNLTDQRWVEWERLPLVTMVRAGTTASAGTAPRESLDRPAPSALSTSAPSRRTPPRRSHRG